MQAPPSPPAQIPEQLTQIIQQDHLQPTQLALSHPHENEVMTEENSKSDMLEAAEPLLEPAHLQETGNRAPNEIHEDEQEERENGAQQPPSPVSEPSNEPLTASSSALLSVAQNAQSTQPSAAAIAALGPPAASTRKRKPRTDLHQQANTSPRLGPTKRPPQGDIQHPPAKVFLQILTCIYTSRDVVYLHYVRNRKHKFLITNLFNLMFLA